MTEEPELEYASISRRISAYVIDMLLWFIVFILYAYTLMFLYSYGGGGPGIDAKYAGNVLVLSLLFFPVVYCFISAWFISCCKWRATIGKKLVNIYIGLEDGSKVGYGEAFGRSFLFMLLNLTGVLAAFVAIALMAVGGMTDHGSPYSSFEFIAQAIAAFFLGSFIPMFLFVYIPIFWTTQRTAWYDRWIGTRVFKGKAAGDKNGKPTI
jgi:uncharacterized RDD family membrane protein YckC